MAPSFLDSSFIVHRSSLQNEPLGHEVAAQVVGLGRLGLGLAAPAGRADRQGVAATDDPQPHVAVAGRGAERLKLRNDHSTIGQLIARYKQNAVQRPSTIRGNVRSLRMIVKTVHRGDPDIKPTSVLTGNLIREFEKRQLERVEKRAVGGTQLSAIQRVHTSTASFVRQARSVVAPRKMKFYDGMKLPDLTGFRRESV